MRDARDPPIHLRTLISGHLYSNILTLLPNLFYEKMAAAAHDLPFILLTFRFVTATTTTRSTITTTTTTTAATTMTSTTNNDNNNDSVILVLLFMLIITFIILFLLPTKINANELKKITPN